MTMKPAGIFNPALIVISTLPLIVISTLPLTVIYKPNNGRKAYH